MKHPTTLALAAAMGAGLVAGTAEAQQFRDFDTLNSARASEGEAVRMRLTIPFGQAEADHRDPRLAFQLQQGDGQGVRSIDMFSFSLTDDAPPRLETPFVFGAAEGEGFFSKPINWLWVGLGVGAAYWIYEETQDDDDSAPPPPS